MEDRYETFVNEFGTRFWYKNGDTEEWWNHGNNITKEVNEWIIDNNIPNYKEWTNKEKAMFKLKFL